MRFTYGIPYVNANERGDITYYSNLNRPYRLPENTLHSFLYNKKHPFSGLLKLNVRLSKLYHTYSTALSRDLTFMKYSERKIGSKRPKMYEIDLDLGYYNILKFADKIGGILPLLSIYKKHDSLIDNLIVKNKKFICMYFFWIDKLDNLEPRKVMELVYTYAHIRSKLLYCDQGLKTKEAIVYMPITNYYLTFPIDIDYPIDIVIELVENKITLGGKFDRDKLEPKGITAKIL